MSNDNSRKVSHSLLNVPRNKCAWGGKIGDTFCHLSTSGDGVEGTPPHLTSAPIRSSSLNHLISIGRRNLL